MRIAVGGIHIECSTYSHVLTEMEDFDVVRGPELLARPAFAFLGESAHTLLPTLHARAIPGGPVSGETYRRLKAEFLERLQDAMPLDGLYLAMHGAMNVDGMDDAEGDWASSARQVVGDACVVSASYDLHGNVSERVASSLDAFSAYRTAPHIDVEETQRRAFALLEGALASGERPVLAWVPVPVLMPGERTSTEVEPARSLYAGLPDVDAVEGVLDASLLVGYVWADEPRATASAVVTAKRRALAEDQAKALATRYWQARARFEFGVPAGTVEACLDRAQRPGAGPAVIADSGDNPTAGGIGDRTEVLRALLARDGEPSLVAGIADPAATARCFEAGVGSELELQVGGRLSGDDEARVAVSARVERLAEDGGPRSRLAVVRVGNITLVLSHVRRPFHNVADFTALGLDLHSFRIVVVKSGYLSPELAAIADPALLALTPGAVNQDIERLPVRRWRRPMYPLDRDFAWSPRVGATSARRGS